MKIYNLSVRFKQIFIPFPGKFLKCVRGSGIFGSSGEIKLFKVGSLANRYLAPANRRNSRLREDDALQNRESRQWMDWIERVWGSGSRAPEVSPRTESIQLTRETRDQSLFTGFNFDSGQRSCLARTRGGINRANTKQIRSFLIFLVFFFFSFLRFQALDGSRGCATPSSTTTWSWCSSSR